MAKTKLMAVGFGTDGCCGDSGYQPEHAVPYVEGMTINEIKRAIQKHELVELWAELKADCTEAELDAAILEQETCSDFAGAWIIEEKMYNVIKNVSGDWGGDSAVYAAIRTMKSQIQAGAIKTLKMRGVKVEDSGY